MRCVAVSMTDSSLHDRIAEVLQTHMPQNVFHCDRCARTFGREAWAHHTADALIGRLGLSPGAVVDEAIVQRLGLTPEITELAELFTSPGEPTPNRKRMFRFTTDWSFDE